MRKTGLKSTLLMVKAGLQVSATTVNSVGRAIQAAECGAADAPMEPWTKSRAGLRVFRGGHLVVVDGPDGGKWTSCPGEKTCPVGGRRLRTTCSETRAAVDCPAVFSDSVVVSSPAVLRPRAVRYAWSNNPEGANPYNRDGLPASPFRTDDWPGVTVGRK